MQIKNIDGTSQIDTIYQFDRYFDTDDSDFAYSRRMGRFDDFYGYYDPWFYGYTSFGYRSAFGYWNPWYIGIMIHSLLITIIHGDFMGLS